MRGSRSVVVISALAPAVATASPSPAVVAKLESGEAALVAGRLPDAEAAFKGVLDQVAVAERGWVWLDLCLTHYASGAYGRAIDDCYRAIAQPMTDKAITAQVIQLLSRIGQQLRGTDLGDLRLPEPDPRWFVAPRSALVGSLVLEPPRPFAALDVVPAEQVDRIAGAPPPLPYSIKPAREEYTSGIDIAAKSGFLFYAPDADHTVVGAQARFHWKPDYHYRDKLLYLEYLQGTDGHSGIGAMGIGVTSPDSAFIYEAGLAIPWGRDHRRVDAMFPGYTTGFEPTARWSYHHELANGFMIEASLSGGFNIGKVLDTLLDDSCHDRSGCEIDPEWAGYHWMFDIGLGFASRHYGRPYAHAEAFAPASVTP